ncbi:hypothetical protein [Dactylosporangium fulvum]|uniref:Uncharacterized protein n=1 Tax=Dactylosporangium fulvum TaxID=53359 RepID=A0ABY5VRZ1_9ACTN|nr:hypothetical protein [Dactylosporangium fulvum]UWP79955.1 hypothetical protein Dfulv_32965 [Dactylosporangium fulvum]
MPTWTAAAAGRVGSDERRRAACRVAAIRTVVSAASTTMVDALHRLPAKAGA